MSIIILRIARQLLLSMSPKILNVTMPFYDWMILFTVNHNLKGLKHNVFKYTLLNHYSAFFFALKILIIKWHFEQFHYENTTIKTANWAIGLVLQSLLTNFHFTKSVSIDLVVPSQRKSWLLIQAINEAYSDNIQWNIDNRHLKWKVQNSEKRVKVGDLSKIGIKNGV